MRENNHKIINRTTTIAGVIIPLARNFQEKKILTKSRKAGGMVHIFNFQHARRDVALH